MPRPLRFDYEGAWHHVMNRGRDGASIFADDIDRMVFLHELTEAAAGHGTEVHAYCLMGNHVHLLVRSEHGRLAGMMQQLAGRFTQRFNARHCRDGALFRGRYRSVLIEQEAQLLCVSRYIHLNPVVAHLATRPEDWPWSSAAAYLGCAERPGWLATGEILSMFGATAALSYRAFLDCGVDPVTARFYGRKTLAPVFAAGSDPFVADLAMDPTRLGKGV